MKTVKLFVVFLAGVLIALTVVGCAPRKGGAGGSKSIFSSEQETLAAVRQRGVLKIGVAVSVPGAMRKKDGELIGYEVDLGKRLAEDLGVKPEFRETHWNDIFTPLVDGDVDVVMGGVGVTPARALIVNFTAPYGKTGVSVLVSKKANLAVRTPADLNKKKVTIGVRGGKFPETLVKDLFPNAKIKSFSDEKKLYQALQKGKLTAVAGYDAWIGVSEMIFKGEVYRPFKKPLTERNQAFAVRKGDTDWLIFLNTWIDSMKLDDAVAERHDYWFKSLSWAKLL